MKNKYNIGDKVETDYGVGKVIAIRAITYDVEHTDNYVYKIKYNFFRRLWCFEFTIKRKVED